MTQNKFQLSALESISDVLGATSAGFKGDEIAKLLGECGIEDIEPTITKRKRLYAALKNKQDVDSCWNHIINFIQHAMSPVRHYSSQE